jgi:hypothetical protein
VWIEALVIHRLRQHGDICRLQHGVEKAIAGIFQNHLVARQCKHLDKQLNGIGTACRDNHIRRLAGQSAPFMKVTRNGFTQRSEACRCQLAEAVAPLFAPAAFQQPRPFLMGKQPVVQCSRLKRHHGPGGPVQRFEDMTGLKTVRLEQLVGQIRHHEQTLAMAAFGIPFGHQLIH